MHVFQMVKFKGKWFYKVKVTCKPIREGIRLYVLACGRTGYAYECIVHAGQNFGKHFIGKVYDKVMALLKSAGVLGQG